MEAMQQAKANSNRGRRLNRNDWGRIFLAGLALFVIHSLSVKLFTPFANYPTMIVGFIFCAVDLLVVLLALPLPFWDEPKSFKLASIACGSAFLTILVFILAWATGILVLDAIGGGFGIDALFDVLAVTISFVPVPHLLGIIGIVWGAMDDRESNHQGPRATQGVKLSLVALAASWGIMMPLCSVSILALGG